MSVKGSTAEHRPVVATAPGIPQTTLDSSSCAITEPPASTTTFELFWPSDPIPVRMTVNKRD